MTYLSVEKRVIMIILSYLDGKSKVDSGTWYGMDVEDYATLLGVKEASAYDVVKWGVNTLLNKTVHIYKQQDIIEFTWIKDIRYISEKRRLEVKWSDGIIPYIYQGIGKVDGKW